MLVTRIVPLPTWRQSSSGGLGAHILLFQDLPLSAIFFRNFLFVSLSRCRVLLFVDRHVFRITPAPLILFSLFVPLPGLFGSLRFWSGLVRSGPVPGGEGIARRGHPAACLARRDRQRRRFPGILQHVFPPRRREFGLFAGLTFAQVYAAQSAVSLTRA